MKKKAIGISVVLILLLALSVAAVAPHSSDLDLYNKDKNYELIGSAQGASAGIFPSITPGETLLIDITNVIFNSQVNTGAVVEVTITHQGQTLESFTGQIFSGAYNYEFMIPSAWDGLYHVAVKITQGQTTLRPQAQFKVEGSCVPSLEVCDGRDNDCDGSIDEQSNVQCGVSDTGTCSLGVRTCTNGQLGVCIGTIDPDIEICNSLDDDCDGLIDEQLTQVCGSNQGMCTEGTQTCSNGQWSQCGGTYQEAQQEACNAVDDDCNGEIDNGLTCQCLDGQERLCGSSAGSCLAGLQRCSGGTWGSCVGDIGPSVETCNGLDDDCDGVVDEQITRSCGQTALGECSLGSQECSNGNWGACTNEITPAVEVCDAKDNDCDGEIDESVTQQCGVSNVGECTYGFRQCTQGGFDDCVGAVYPATEICDGLDNDCDGFIDEDVIDVSTGTFTGECQEGIQQCIQGNMQQVQTPVGPGVEICDGLDNDCDGDIDNGLLCECIDGETQSCGSDVGACSTGVQVCVNGVFGACQGSVGASQEACNGADDDCDGEVDEELTITTGSDEGICQSEQQECIQGQYQVVQDAITSRQEICDGIDNDCDGIVDEQLTKTCGSNVGVCSAGLQTCSEGDWGACIGEVTGSIEVCNAVDDDCDGEIDEAISQVCGSAIGECQVGSQLCSNGDYGQCNSLGPVAEQCDGLDNDCNGLVDDGISCDCVSGNTRSCGSSQGSCSAGAQTCLAGVWGICSGAVGPVTEQCDGVDNDCDGVIDEDLRETFGVDVCQQGIRECRKGVFEVIEDPVNPSPELCNGVDDDCDGEIDEDLVIICGDSNQGQCKLGLQRCTAGEWGLCEAEIKPAPESCNLIDDDCDGIVDEDISLSCGSDVGECRKGTRICVAGGLAGCGGSIDPVVEVCDGLDNDCDGETDEGIICSCLTGQTRPCGTNAGLCSTGNQECVDGEWDVCIGAVEGNEEVCDAMDNDCDGLVDEDLPALVRGIDEGVCQKEIMECTSGFYQFVQRKIDPSAEICDGLDNDCDGLFDEGIPEEKTGSDVGACQKEIIACSDGELKIIQEGISETIEICDGLDNDCDGFIDEDLEEVTGVTEGVCQEEMIACVNGELVFTQEGILPSNEICDGLDNNCNGDIDEFLLCECQEGETQSCGSDAGVCIAGVQTCVNGIFGECTGEVSAGTEICNGLDDDCDGDIDESVPTVVLGVNAGNCQAEITECVNGIYVISQKQITKSIEVCNGIDDDCDGEIDNLPDRVDPVLQGVCVAPREECVNGELIIIQGVESSTELCDGLDNDCDGEVDEACEAVEEVAPVVTEHVQRRRSSRRRAGAEATLPAPVSVPSIPGSSIPLAPSMSPLTGGGGIDIGLELVVGEVPQALAIDDSIIVVQGVVRNVGDLPLQDIRTFSQVNGVTTEGSEVDSLQPGEQKVVTFEVETGLCKASLPAGDYSLSTRGREIEFHAQASEFIRASEIIRIPYTLPGFAVTTASVGKTDIKVCFFVDNPGDQPRKKLEIEFTLSDRSHDLLIDYISPVRVDAGETLLKVKDYKLQYVPQEKDYTLRGHLYENGSVFSKGYVAGEDQTRVHLTKVQQRAWWNILRDLWRGD